MTDERELLREFRADAPPLDAEARQRVYMRATGSRGRIAAWKEHRGAEMSLRNSSLWLTGAVACAALCAAFAALVLTGVFGGGKGPHRTALGPSPLTNQPTQFGAGPGASVFISPNRSEDGTLTSLDVTVNPDFADAGVEIEVLHSTGGAKETVYKTQIVAGTIPSCGSGPTGQIGPTGAYGPTGCHATGASTWSGTLVPTDWSGGCQAGTYWISAVAVPAGTSLSEATSENSERFGSQGFTCSPN